MGMEIREMTEQERMYTYTQSKQIRMQTGNIGYLRADMDSSGRGFFSNWNSFRDDLRTEEFKHDLKNVIDTLRFEDRYGSFLKDRVSLAKYCYSHFQAGDSEGRSFFFRADTEKYSYMLRLNPTPGEYNLYCYCYRRDWLDHHLKAAERGIRFIDSDYKELFRLKDGGKISLSFADGSKETLSCRYIDDYHLEAGFGSSNIYHICEFAEKREKAGIDVRPADPKMVIEPAKKRMTAVER